MNSQSDINERMRAILIDWLVYVHRKFNLVPHTLHLCVSIIDKFCSEEQVSRNELQLVGVTALFLACKYEEILPVKNSEIVYITDGAYTKKEVVEMEQRILKVCNWKMNLPTEFSYLHRFLSLTKASSKARHAASYYLESTLLNHDILDYRPSFVCASAVTPALNNQCCQSETQGMVMVS